MLVIKLERERESKHESEGVAIYVYVQSKCISNNSTTPKTTPFILGEFQYNKVRAHITHTLVSVETSCDAATLRAMAGPKTCPLRDREREGGREREREREREGESLCTLL